MKFGRVLALRAIPEWRESYVGYKKLKRLLKRLPGAKGGDHDDFSPVGSPSASLSGSHSNLATTLSEPLLNAEYTEVTHLFFAELDDDLRRVNLLVRWRADDPRSPWQRRVGRAHIQSCSFLPPSLVCTHCWILADRRTSSDPRQPRADGVG